MKMMLSIFLLTMVCGCATKAKPKPSADAWFKAFPPVLTKKVNTCDMTSDPEHFKPATCPDCLPNTADREVGRACRLFL